MKINQSMKNRMVVTQMPVMKKQSYLDIKTRTKLAATKPKELRVTVSQFRKKMR